MGLFDMFRRPKSELEKMEGEWVAMLFPGGRQEILFKADVVHQLCNGKLTKEEAGRLCFSLKSRIKHSVLKFDGRKNLGPKAEVLFESAKSDTQNKLTTAEAAAVVFYLLFDKPDPGVETPIAVKKYLETAFGSDSVGCDADEMPGGLGEFGFDATNPIPVRGLASNTVYLESLRTKDGRKIDYKRIGSLLAPNIFGNIDEFEVAQGGRPLCKLYISPYNQKISGRPPRGFVLVQTD